MLGYEQKVAERGERTKMWERRNSNMGCIPKSRNEDRDKDR